MIFHFSAIRSDPANILFRGAPVATWYPRLYPELNWYYKGDASGDDLVFIWNDSFLVSLDHFDEWLDKANLSLPGIGEWVSPPDRLFWLTRTTTTLPSLNNPIDRTFLESLPNIRTIPAEPSIPRLNDPYKINEALRSFQYRHYMRNGVEIVDAANFYIENLPQIGPGTRIHTGSVIEGACQIGSGVRIGPSVHLVNVRIGNDAVVLTGSLIYDSEIGACTQIGPYAHLRAGTIVDEEAKIGNFVEIKKSSIGKGSKAMHLSYIGDATVGRKVNIGAGTITCNYDGINKNPTNIGDNVFVGSGTELVAPVTLEDESFIAAGSTITESVPSQALAVARTRQRIIPHWTQKRTKK